MVSLIISLDVNAIWRHAQDGHTSDSYVTSLRQWDTRSQWESHRWSNVLIDWLLYGTSAQNGHIQSWHCKRENILLIVINSNKYENRTKRNKKFKGSFLWWAAASPVLVAVATSTAYGRARSLTRYATVCPPPFNQPPLLKILDPPLH